MGTKYSVVIPLYNKEAYIQRAILSVINQSISASEIVVIDDGSTDSSASIVKGISDHRIRLIQQPNAGECAARNKGIIEAQNEMIALLDADDEWKPDFLATIDGLYTQFPNCGLYATSYIRIEKSGEIYFPKIVGIQGKQSSGILVDYFKILQKSMPFFPSSVVISRQASLEIGGFPNGVKRGGDIIMWIRMGNRYPICFSPDRQVIYHTEAENRACDVFSSLDESATAKEISTMLEAGKISKIYVDDLREYRFLLNIKKAKEILLLGDYVTAKKLLGESKETKFHKLEWLFLFFWSTKFSSKILLRIRNVYARLKHDPSS